MEIQDIRTQLARLEGDLRGCLELIKKPGVSLTYSNFAIPFKDISRMLRKLSEAINSRMDDKESEPKHFSSRVRTCEKTWRDIIAVLKTNESFLKYIKGSWFEKILDGEGPIGS